MKGSHPNGKFKAFDVKDVKDLPSIPDKDESGQPISYLFGWFLVPSYILQNFDSFQPVDAVDCGHGKAASKMVLIARACLDAERHVHAMSMAQMLCGECSWGMEKFFQAEKEAFGERLNQRWRVTIADGGAAIMSAYAAAFPEVHSTPNSTRCMCVHAHIACTLSSSLACF